MQFLLVMSFIVNGSQNIKIPIRYTLHGGRQIKVLKNGLFHKALFISPNFLFDLQSNFKQFNFGSYFVDGVLGVRASADLQIVAVATGGYAGDGSASFHISAGVSVHKSGCIGLLAVHRHFRRVGCLEKDEFHGRVGVFTPNLLHMPGVRVAGQRERAAPFRFVTFEQRSKMGQTG